MEKDKPDDTPVQQLGDTPVAPWEMPTPAEKAKAEPVRRELKQAVENIDSPAAADEVAEHLEQLAGQRKATDVEKVEKAAETVPASEPLTDAARAVKQAGSAAEPAAKKASDVITETAEKIAGANGRERETLAQAAQEVLNPEQQGAATAPQRAYLRQAVIKRMKPLDALDAQIYLAINHLPHNRLLNGLFYTLTFVFTGGGAWYGLLGLLTLMSRKRGWAATRATLAPLILSSATVEFPVKTYFRRRRPFITFLQATVIGKKPGSWSFPSGHSAAAFGGAYLLGRQFPRQRWLFYTVATLVAFSRIYLGDHYPGDVVSGSVAGVALAKGAADLQATMDAVQTTAPRWPWQRRRSSKRRGQR